MGADSPDLVVAMRLLDHLKLGGFEFQRTAPGEDGSLVGYRVSVDYVDLIHIEGSAATALPGESEHRR